MLNRIPGRRAYILSLVLILSVLLTATTVSAATKYMKAKFGGTIYITSGVKLVIPKDALPVTDNKDIKSMAISADVELANDRVSFMLGPSGLSFNVPLRLEISWSSIISLDLDSFVLYGPNGEEIRPQLTSYGLRYDIPHFSLYYHRRR
jgi:hypothetical protein